MPQLPSEYAGANAGAGLALRQLPFGNSRQRLQAGRGRRVQIQIHEEAPADKAPGLFSEAIQGACDQGDGEILRPEFLPDCRGMRRAFPSQSAYTRAYIYWLFPPPQP